MRKTWMIIAVFVAPLLLVRGVQAGECDPQCQGRNCGDDGCGGACGECAGACVGGVCVSDCDDLPAAGCCLGDSLVWCPHSKVTVSPCAPYLGCGWSQEWDGYACGTAGGSDPSGAWPKECASLCKPDCEDRQCGDDGCAGECGTCADGQVCVEGGCCTPSCDGKQCGPDGCGGLCENQCAGTQGCLNGQCCQPDCQGKACGPDGCGGECGPCVEGACLDFHCFSEIDPMWPIGCCYEGDLVYGMANGHLIGDDCSGGKECGWNPDGQLYECVENAGPDPTGLEPWLCVFHCTPDCEGKECGGDGCGGTCGECGVGQVCLSGSTCCTPFCTGFECGSDGCGGSCGECTDGQTECIDHMCASHFGCVATFAEPGCKGCGCEECVCLKYPWCCVEWEGWTFECSLACEQECGGCTACEPSCEGKQCGSDGCWGVCGVCAPGESCVDGACCSRQCDGKECGDDGCGGRCGSCPAGFGCDAENRCVPSFGCAESDLPGCGGCKCEYLVCYEHPECCSYFWYDVCVEECQKVNGCAGTCTGSCENKACGPDGCGGSCGSCQEGQVCHLGTCCTPTCSSDGCGVPDGCGGLCGERCDLGSRCQNGKCVSTCADECAGKQCGFGECGGECDPDFHCWGYGSSCVDGVCRGACADYLSSCCLGNRQLLCVDIWKVKECGGAEGCGWNESEDRYTCGGSGLEPTGAVPNTCSLSCRAPTCEGRTCGGDGCGGVCGVCPAGSVCRQGSCCQQECSGKQCGPDGCGGFCGDCPLGSRCMPDGSCSVCQSPCEGKVCGPDGCGGYCGDCPESQVCVGGQCQEGCGWVTRVGCCDGETFVTCELGELVRQRCPQVHNYCGWDAEAGRYGCDTDGAAEPTGAFPMACPDRCSGNCVGKECGSDGCQSDCGQCGAGESCVDGACVASVDPELHPDVTEGEPDRPPEVQTELPATDLSHETMPQPDKAPDSDSPDTSTPPHKKSGDSCSVGTAPSGAAGLLLLAFLLLLSLSVGFRRKT